MDIFFTEYLTDVEVATTKAVAKDCPCDFTPGSPHEPLSPVSSMQLPKFKSLSVEKKKKKAAAKAEAAKAAAEAEAAWACLDMDAQGMLELVREKRSATGPGVEATGPGFHCDAAPGPSFSGSLAKKSSPS